MTAPAPRPFRFGLVIREAATPDSWRSKVLRAQDCGFSTLLVGDHLGARFAPFSALQAAAAWATEIRVGTFVLNTAFLHPVLIAREAATLDRLSLGRLELGLGAGWIRSEFEGLGVPYGASGDRLRRLGESVAIITQLFESGSCQFEGEFFSVHIDQACPRPAQEPRPPILLGGSTPAAWRLAFHHADIVSLTARTRPGGQQDPLLPEEYVASFMSAAKSESPGRSQPEINVLASHVSVKGNVDRARSQLARETGLEREDVDDSIVCLAGSRQSIIDLLERRRASLGLSYIAVLPEAVPDFLPIVRDLAGQ